jgi:monoamine oxidase
MSNRFSNSVSRRGFNVALASSMAGSLLARPALATDSADVIVIGAGLAGLNSALLLEELGFKVIVLEAADHVGGRTRTFDLPVGPTNAGGQTIGPFYARMRELVSRLEVPLVPVIPSARMGNYVNGSLMASTDWAESKANLTVGAERSVQPAALEFHYLSTQNPLRDPADWTEEEYARYDVPLKAYLRDRGASDEAVRLIEVTINAFDLSSCSALAYLRDIRRLQWGMEGADSDTQSTYGVAEGTAFPYNEVAGGTQRLPEAMARALAHEVRLNQVVRSIDMSGSGVEVRTLDGARYRGRYIIAAVPFSALRNVDVFPSFTGAQLDAVRRSEHGNTVRVFMEYTAPFWEADIGEPGLFTDTAIERVFARTNENGEIFVIDCWVNGNAAYRLDQLPSAAVGEFVVDQLERIRPSTKGRLKVLKVHSWAKHSASGCCRHVYNAGQVGLWAGEIARPHHRLHLAGEQTRSLENGMEAAIKTGERAALEILEREA